MLFACIVVPYFVVQATLRSEPEAQRGAWRNRPVAVFDGPESLPRIVACNETARLAGVETGSTKIQAAQCPGIILRNRNRKQEQAAQEALLDCAAAFSPRVESTTEGVVTLDVTGTEKIIGSPPKLVRSLARHAARIGLEVNVAAATSPDTALLIAKGIDGTTVIPAGSDAACLAELPVDVLPRSEAQAEILNRWGIRTCRDLALLPPVPLVERLGQSGLYLQRLARGEVSRTLVPVDPPLKFKESFEFEDSVEDLDSLLFVLKRLLEQITARLISRSLATDELRLSLGLEIHEDRELRKESRKAAPRIFERRLNLPISMQDTNLLLKLLQLDLAQCGPGAPVKSVTLEARAARRRATQGSLFAPAGPEPERLEVILARIRAIVGEVDPHGRGRVGSSEVLASHQPDDFRITAFPSYDVKRAEATFSRHPAMTMSMFRPPLAAQVLCQAGKLVHISFAEITCPIVCAAGPWNTSGNWWKKDEEWRREEWDIAVQRSNGVDLYRIFRDLRQNAWFVEGLYN